MTQQECTSARFMLTDCDFHEIPWNVHATAVTEQYISSTGDSDMTDVLSLVRVIH
jgi:hypothetical protein